MRARGRVVKFSNLMDVVISRLYTEQETIEEVVDRINSVTTIGSGTVTNTVIMPDNIVEFINEDRYEVDIEITLKKVKK